MSTQIQRRRGTTAQHASFTGAVGETTIDTDKEVVVVHDGVQVGGYPLMREDGSNSALALGSAGTPSLKFTGDTNTGIYSPGADQLAISTAGSGRITIDGSGNVSIDSNTLYVDATNNRVGVGTGSPGSNLDVRFGTNPSVDNGGGADALRVWTSSALAADAGGAVSFGGVATSGGGFGSWAQIAGRKENATSGAYGGYLQFAVNTGSGTMSERARIDSSGSFIVKGAGTAGSTQAVSFNGSAPVNSLVIDSSGRLGVGTSSPAALLHLSATAGNQELRFSDTTNSAMGRIYESNGLVIISETNHGISFQTNATARGGFEAGGNFFIDTNTLYVDATNNRVGIGTTPDSKLHVVDAIGNALRIGYDSGVTNKNIYDANQHLFRDVNGNSSVTIDSSKRLLVGTTSALGTNNSITIKGTAASNPSIYFGRNANASSIVADNVLGFLEFGSGDGGLGAEIKAVADGTWSSTSDCQSRLVFSVTADGASSPTTRMTIKSDGTTQFVGAITPNADNAQNVGSASVRWATVYAATGTINTSDANLKQDIENLEQTELNVAAAIKNLIKKYRFIDAVATKGDDARIHVGVIAQEVEQAFVNEGLDPRRYALFCEDTIEDGSKRLGIRYDELLAFVIAAL